MPLPRTSWSPAAFLHADTIATWHLPPSVEKYGVAPISGFFLDVDNVQGVPVFPTEMRNLFGLANASGGVNQACIAAAPDPADRWRCFFAQSSFMHTVSPVFTLNSAVDMWQTSCVLAATLPTGFPNTSADMNKYCDDAPGWHACAFAGDCNASQVAVLSRFREDFMAEIESATFEKPGNGAFLHSCHTHCEAQDNAWNAFAIGGVTMQQAVSRWWHDAPGAPAAPHTHRPCVYRASSNYTCNPTCCTFDELSRMVGPPC